jgi:DNA-binding response OmpR family regulator
MRNRRRTVLVVDDDDGIRGILTAQLMSEGYNVVTAHDGERALELLRKCTVDLLIVDFVMPGKDGVQVITNVRVTRPELRIIAISGDIDSDVYLRAAKNLGVDVRLQKPFTHEQLQAALSSVCG